MVVTFVAHVPRWLWFLEIWTGRRRTAGTAQRRAWADRGNRICRSRWKGPGPRRRQIPRNGTAFSRPRIWWPAGARRSEILIMTERKLSKTATSRNRPKPFAPDRLCLWRRRRWQWWPKSACCLVSCRRQSWRLTVVFSYRLLQSLKWWK